MSAPNFTWIDAPAAKPALKPMRVKVATDVGSRYEYEGLFATTFDAYDNALNRFVRATRIEVQTLPAKTAEVPRAA